MNRFCHIRAIVLVRTTCIDWQPKAKNLRSRAGLKRLAFAFLSPKCLAVYPQHELHTVSMTCLMCVSVNDIVLGKLHSARQDRRRSPPGSFHTRHTHVHTGMASTSTRQNFGETRQKQERERPLKRDGRECVCVVSPSGFVTAAVEIYAR